MIKKFITSFTLMSLLFAAVPAVALAGSTCGTGSDSVKVSFDIGCSGKGNPILDATFAIIRFLSDGVGLVIIASLVIAGIQYSSSKGDPQASEKAVKRMRSTVVALILFIFAYPLLNYLMPAGFLK